MLNHLRQIFGFDHFVGAQEEVVSRILQGEELCVVMPTGAGKSLCYQLPILMRPGYGLVLSPLIALMRDQVSNLQQKNIPAACLNSDMSHADQQLTMQELMNGRVKLLYVAPERFRATGFVEFLQQCPPSLLVIDEAHCISQWGHEFRPDYQLIWSHFPILGQLQACAFTATATPYVRRDIKVQLQRPHMKELVSGFKRPNLSFQVRTCKNSEKDRHLVELLKRKIPTIIYTSTRKETENLAAKFHLVPYHAGLSPRQRNDAQQYFMQDPCPVLVATNAFGMGIDRPDIRQVIHYNAPGSLEAYYQEAGRAGRDGEPADCILFHSYQDKIIQDYLLEMNHPDPRILKAVHRYLYGIQTAGGYGYRPEEDGSFENLPLDKDMQKKAMAAMRILERHHILTREMFSACPAPGELNLLAPVEQVLEKNKAEDTQRSRFLHRVALLLQERNQSILSCMVEELAAIGGLPVPNVIRVLEALEGEALHWLPPGNGEVYRLTELGMKKQLQIDLQELQRQKDYNQEKLNEVQKYCYARSCRQNYLISYFGEDIGGWKCGQCDRCNAGRKSRPDFNRPATAREIELANSILLAIASVSGEFGRKRIVNMLHGEHDSNPFLDGHPSRGICRQLSTAAIGRLIDALENQEYLVQSKGEYPCLELSTKAFRILRNKTPLDLVMPKHG